MGPLRILIALNGIAMAAAGIVLFLDPQLIAGPAGIEAAGVPTLAWTLLGAAELGLAAMCLLSLSSGAEVLGIVALALIVFHAASAVAGVQSVMASFNMVVVLNVAVRVVMVGLLAWLGLARPKTR